MSTALLANEHLLQTALAYYKAPEGTMELAPDVRERFDRWEKADQLVRRHGDMNLVVSMLCRQFKYSPSSARRDIQAAQYVFGSMHHIDTKYCQRFSMELLMKAMVTASDAGDFKALAALNKEWRETVGLNKSNTGVPLPGQLQWNPLIVTDDYVAGEDQLFTDQDIEEQTQRLLAKYRTADERVIEVPPSNATAGDTTDL